MNINLDDLEIFFRNLMLSQGHASEMLPLVPEPRETRERPSQQQCRRSPRRSQNRHRHLHPMSTIKSRAPLPRSLKELGELRPE
jgi:hypothetical protein